MQTKLGSRSVKVAALGLALTFAGVAVPNAVGAAPDRAESCPSATRIVAGFGRGLEALVRAGDLTRDKADAAGEQFAGWLRDDAPASFGCDIRAAMIDHAREVLGLIGLGPLEARAAFRDGQSLAEMAEANGVERGELVETLNGMVAEHIASLEAAGAIDAGVADAFESLAAEHIDTVIDFEQGDPRPAGVDDDRG